MTQELVDYSRTANDDWAGLAQALKAAEKVGIGRYCVNDKSPGGRGIGPDEYEAMTAAGIEVFFYWESSEGWMLGGETAGMSAALNAQTNLNLLFPPTVKVPVYFAADYDFSPEQQPLIDDCLRGCAKVLGADRVGIYGGFYVVRRCAENGTAKWFTQTSAWSRDIHGNLLWFDGNHLEQYDYNHIIHGTNCDDVRAMQANYGQVSKFLKPSKPPKYAEKKPIPGPTKTQTYGGKAFVRAVGGLTLAKDTAPLQYASPTATATARPYVAGRKITPQYATVGTDGHMWIVEKNGSRWPFSAFVEGQ